MSTLVDSSVILDITDAGTWAGWSTRHLQRTRDNGGSLINPVVYAEISCRFMDRARIDGMLATIGINREDLGWDAAHLAGQAHLLYRRRGGTRERTLPDFLVGAHASVKGHTLLTRDARRYREYFPDLDIIAPDTHP